MKAHYDGLMPENRSTMGPGDAQLHIGIPGQSGADIRNSLDVPAPVTDVNGLVRRVNEEFPVIVEPQNLPDPVRYGMFDGWYGRRRAQITVAFTQLAEWINPPISGGFMYDKQEIEMKSSPPRGSQYPWDWDTNRRNLERPVADTYGDLVPSTPPGAF